MLSPHILQQNCTHGAVQCSVAIGKPEWHVRKASYNGSKQQWRSHAAITLLLLVHGTYKWCYSSRTSRSWRITHLTQRHRRGCNNSNKNARAGAGFERRVCVLALAERKTI